MPDILGYWDRRADNPDFNPHTKQIEPGYAKREKRRYQRQKRTEKKLLNKLYTFLKNTGINKSELKEVGYSLVHRYGPNDVYCGSISGKIGGLNEGRLRVNKKTQEVTIEVVYKDQLEVDHAIKYDKSFIENQIDLERIASAIKLRNFLDKKKIHYKEEPSRQEVKSELSKLNNKVSGLIKKL